jgi:urea transport system permease protein
VKALLAGGGDAPTRTTPPWARWALVAVVALVVLVVVPAALTPFRLNLAARYLCYAMVGVGICLAWGRGGMLTLGQGVFFGLGGYAMGMHLKLAEAAAIGEELPDFMVWSGVQELPAVWAPFAHAWFALAAVVVVPTVVALVLGTLVFRQRVRGAYFAILSQALAAAFVIWLVGQQALTGGTNGLTNIRAFFGLNLSDPADQRTLYLVVAVVLGAIYLVAHQVVQSRFGRLLVAIRDGEDRVRFLGYDPALVKTLTFAASAAMAGIGGALIVPVVGIISPAMLGVVPSIAFVIGVAVGGRATLAGAVVGTVLVNYAQTRFSEAFASGWLYLQGAMFVIVMMYAPKGLAGLLASAQEWWLARRPPSGDPDAPGGASRVPPATDPVEVPA